MKKRLFTALLVLAVILSAFPAVTAVEASLVTVTYPDGTVVQMTLQAYLEMLGVQSSPSATQTPTDEPPAPDAVPWPTYNLTKHKLTFKDEWGHTMSYCGPSRNYAESGYFENWEITRVDGMLIEGTYVLVEINYTKMGLRRIYMNRGNLEGESSVPETTLTGYPAVTTKSASAWYGPGPMYNAYQDASVGANTALTVFFEENGYVFAEYEAGFQLVRAWLDADSVKPE